MAKLDTFTEAYLEAMLWAETHCWEGTEHDGESFDDLGFTMADIDHQSLVEIVNDCRDFQEANADDMDGKYAQAGHDFYLTRNGHGAGFWDGDWPEPQGTRLTNAAHVYGTQGLHASTEDAEGPLYIHG